MLPTCDRVLGNAVPGGEVSGHEVVPRARVPAGGQDQPPHLAALVAGQQPRRVRAGGLQLGLGHAVLGDWSQNTGDVMVNWLTQCPKCLNRRIIVKALVGTFVHFTKIR